MHDASVLSPDTNHSVSTSSTDCVLEPSSSSLHDTSVSSPDTDHSVSTPDTERVPRSPQRSPSQSQQLATKRVSDCRPNTTPKFRTFVPSIGLEVHSTLKPDHWRALLKHYPDPQFPNILTGIAKYGARVGYEGPFVRIRRSNHSSVLRISTEISQNIAKEVAVRRVKEIHSLPQFYYVSPLGAVEKRLNGAFNGWRRIHDLSCPLGTSTNDGIREEYGTLSYQTVDDAIRLIQKHGHRCILRKRDLKDAFRMIPVSPLDHWLFLFEWQGKLYVDIFLPFGLRTAPFLFNLFGEGLHWILERVFSRDLVHYLDDFLLFNDPDPEFFGTIVSYLGLAENIKKRRDGWVVDFTGIELDSDCMVARLPKDKHDRAIAGVQRLLTVSAVTHRTLEKLLGFLSFCAKVVPLGRPFLRNLFNLLQRLSHLHPNAMRNLSPAARRDLLWWMTLLPQWSGVMLINSSRSQVVIHTDASGVKGIGGWWDNQHAYSTRLSRNYRDKLIDWKEAYAVLFAFAKWGQLWAGHSVVVMCDNTVVVNAINSRSVRGQAIDPLQLLFLTAALYDIEVSSKWLSSKDNWIADALSRFELEKIADIFPQFQSVAQNNSHRPYRETGKPMSELREKLQTFFGTASLPTLAKSIESAKLLSKNSLRATDLILPSQSSSKRSHNSLQQRPRKRQRRQQKHTSLTYEATTSIKATPPKFSMTNASNVSSEVLLANTGVNQSMNDWRSRRKYSKRSS
jgi:hypothetical protein